MKKRYLFAIIAFILAAVFILASCSSIMNSSEQKSSAPGSGGAPSYDNGSSTNKGSSGEYESPHQSDYTSDKNPDVTAGRKLIKTAALTLETLEYIKSYNAIMDRITSVGGYIESSNEHGSGKAGSTRSYTAVIRVPADKLNEFLSDPDSLGNVKQLTSDTDDVTDNYFDTESRLNQYRIQESRYLALLEKAENMADIITLENALTNVRYNIESLTGTLNKYDALIAYSTVTVTLNEVYDYSKEVNPSDPLLTRLLQRLKDSWKALIDFGEFLLLALVTVLPFIVIPVIIIIIIFIVRNKRKSKKQKDEGSKN